MRRLASWWLVLAAIGGCPGARALPVIAVTGVDFAFIAPDSATAGPTRFRFTHRGTVPHELAIARVTLGVRVERVLDTELKGGDVEGLYDPGEGLLYADVGEHVDAELLVDLQPGRTYVLNCTLDGPGGKSHAMLGMVRPLHVRAR